MISPTTSYTFSEGASTQHAALYSEYKKYSLPLRSFRIVSRPLSLMDWRNTKMFPPSTNSAPTSSMSSLRESCSPNNLSNRELLQLTRFLLTSSFYSQDCLACAGYQPRGNQVHWVLSISYSLARETLTPRAYYQIYKKTSNISQDHDNKKRRCISVSFLKLMEDLHPQM